MYNPLWINVTWLVILCHPTHDDVEMWHRTNMSNLFCTNDERTITPISTILKWISPKIFVWYFRMVSCNGIWFSVQLLFIDIKSWHWFNRMSVVMIQTMNQTLTAQAFYQLFHENFSLYTNKRIPWSVSKWWIQTIIFFSYMKHLSRWNDTYTRLTCSKLNNYHWNVYYCLQAHQRFMQMYTFTWNAKQIFFFFK